MASLGDLIAKVGADISGFEQGMGSVQTQLKRAGSQMESLGSSLSNVGARMTAAITVPLVGVGVAALKVAGELEQNSIAFKTLLGSAAASQKMLENLKKFALSTPFEFTDLTVATKRLLALGFAAGEVIPTLTAVGNATAALGSGAEGIQRITTALGQMQAKGKVQAEEMRQLAEAGIPAWQILAKTLNVDVAGAMKMVEKRAVDASVAIPSLLAGMNQKFGGLMAAQATSMLGLWSNVKDALGFTLADIGKTLMPFAKSLVIDTLQPALEKAKALSAAFAELNPKIQSAALGIAAAAVAAPPLIWALGQLVTGVGGAYKALAGLLPLLMSPTGLIVALGTATVAAVGYGIFKLTELNSKLDETYTKFEQSKNGVNQWAGAWDKAAGDSLAKGLGMTVKIGSAVAKTADEISAAKKAVAQLASAFSTLGVTDVGREIQILNDAWNTLAASGRINADVLDAYNRKMQELSNLVPGVTQAYLNLGLQQDALAKGWSDITSGLSQTGLSLDQTQKQISAARDAMKSWQDGTLATFPASLIDVTQNTDLLTYSMERLGQVFRTDVEASLEATMRALNAVKGTIFETSSVMSGIGLKSTVDLRVEANRLGAAYERIVQLNRENKATTDDVTAAYEKWGDAERKAAGISTTSRQEQKKVLQEVSTIINDMARNIAQSIIHWKGFGEAARKTLEAIGEAILRNIITKLLDASGAIDILMKGLGKVLSSIGLEGAGAAIGKTAASQAAGSVPTPAAPKTGGGSSAGGGLSGALGWANLGVSAASGVVTGIQLARIESDVAKIEISTRQCKEQLTGGIQTALNTYLPELTHLVDIWGALTNGPLQDIDDMLRYGVIHVTTDPSDIIAAPGSTPKQQGSNTAPETTLADLALSSVAADVKSISRKLLDPPTIRGQQTSWNLNTPQGAANAAALALHSLIHPEDVHQSTFDERLAALRESATKTASGGLHGFGGSYAGNPAQDLATFLGVSLKNAQEMLDRQAEDNRRSATAAQKEVYASIDTARSPEEILHRKLLHDFNLGLISSAEMFDKETDAQQRQLDILQDPAHRQAAAQAAELADAQRGLIPATTAYQQAQRDLADSTRGLQQQVDALQHSFWAGDRSPASAAALTAQANAMGSGVAMQAGLTKGPAPSLFSEEQNNVAIQQYANWLQDLESLRTEQTAQALSKSKDFASLAFSKMYGDWIEGYDLVFSAIGESRPAAFGEANSGLLYADSQGQIYGTRKDDPSHSASFKALGNYVDLYGTYAKTAQLPGSERYYSGVDAIDRFAAPPIDYKQSLKNYASNLNAQWTTAPVAGAPRLMGGDSLSGLGNVLNDYSAVNGGSIPNSSTPPGMGQSANIYVTAVDPTSRSVTRELKRSMTEAGVRV